MFSYQVDIYEKQNGAWGWNTLSGWTRPFTDGTRLDETLDGGTINLSCVTRQKAIKPFTRLRFIVSENGTEKERIYRLVASARRTRKKYAGTPLYDWTINTIELTKLLERRLIDTMTVTKYLQKNYESSYYALPVEDRQYDLGGHIAIGTLPKYKLYPITGTTISSDASYITIDDTGSGLVDYYWEIAPSTKLKDANGNIIANNTIPSAGTYMIEMYAKLRAFGVQYADTLTITWTVYAYENEQIAPKTITSVCRRLLSAGVTRRNGVESQEFLLDPTFASEYDEILAPEFSFTNCTLFEALLQVGGYIHSIPRLVPRSISDDTHYYVTFDKLGGDEQAPTMPSLIYSESTIDVNDWCGQIDTPAQNLVNTEDVTGGSITELGDSFITVRTEEGQVEINADDVIIRVSKPIQQIVKVECGYIPNLNNNVGNDIVGDISAFVYEHNEYKTLSSYWEERYPYSKGWAIYYTQGSDTINGLSFVLNKAVSEETAFESQYAIVNIINAVTGANLTKTQTARGEFMRKLAFRVTYVPIAQARVKAHKPSLSEGGAVNNALTYNQSANIAETSYYGEKMRGAIARLGHDVETRTYDIFTYSQLPKVGQLLDDKYIAHIDYEWDITKVRITIALTKDFNMLSQFVGLNSNYRLYDISEKQSVERNVNYDELVVVGDAPAVDMQKYMMNCNVRDMIAFTIGGLPASPFYLRVAKLTPYDANGNEIPNRRVILPAVAFPFGTSIALNVSYFDNYGAGYQQSDAYENEPNKSVQRLVPYTDSFGEIAGLKISFTHNTGWTQSSASDYDDGEPAMMYPQLLTADTGSNYVTTGDYLLNVQKDSREVLNFTYQMHFVSTRANLFIGSGMSKYNPYIAPQSGVSTKVLWLKHSINGLNRYIELGDGQVVNSVGVVPDSKNIVKYNVGTCPINGCKAYAVCKQVTVGNQTKYELLFGENFESDLATGDTVPLVYFAGALMQACNQDEPTRLKFVNDTEVYYVYDESANTMTMTGTIQGTWAVDTINVFLHEREGYVPTRYYAIHGYTDSTITTPQTVYILQSTARNRLVSAYDFE